MRWLAKLFIRGESAPFIHHDLEEMYARDRAGGMPPLRARARYARRACASALNTWRAGLPRLAGIDWLDVKLAFRMMVRYPGLTIVACFAMGIGIPVALAPLQLLHALNVDLPFEDGGRIVGIKYRFMQGIPQHATTLFDLERFQETLSSFETIGAIDNRVDNVIGADGRAGILRGAEVTASALALPRVKPILGRALLPDDEKPGAEPVAVISHDVWKSHFDGVPDAVGRTLRFGRTTRTVVGVMPEGFLFPYREYFWVPLQARASQFEPDKGPGVLILGRLKRGVTLEQAEAEVLAVDAAEKIEAHGPLRPWVLPGPQAIMGVTPPRTHTGRSPLYLGALLLLGVTCGNIGTLIFARGAARSTEIAVRTALGAGRSRIVGQLFVESLVLALVAAALSLGVIAVLLAYIDPLLRKAPYWFDVGVTPYTLAVMAGFALFCALVAGVLPALKLTSRDVARPLQHRAGTGLRFGAVTTVLIAAELALAVGGLTGVASLASTTFVPPSIGDGIPVEQSLTTEVKLWAQQPDEKDRPAMPEFVARLRAQQAEVVRRLKEEPGVRDVTLASGVPGMDHPAYTLEVEHVGERVIRFVGIQENFFETLDQRMLAGRSFDAGDYGPRFRPAVIVNRSFVEQAFEGGPAVGRRIRWIAPEKQPPRPWMEIVGVVNDLGLNVANPGAAAGIYRPVTYGEFHPAHLLVRVAGDATAFAPRLRTVLTSIDPAMAIADPVRLDQIWSEKFWEARMMGAVFTSIAVIAVVLSAAGLYALMAFAVTQRTRELAVRVALGARPRQIARSVILRALTQLLAGVAAGIALGVWLMPEMMGAKWTPSDVWWRLAAVSVVMIAVGLIACAGPTRRALRIQPIDALKEI